MKLKPSKCHFLKHSVDYVGHVISENGVQTNLAPGGHEIARVDDF